MALSSIQAQLQILPVRQISTQTDNSTDMTHNSCGSCGRLRNLRAPSPISRHDSVDCMGSDAEQALAASPATHGSGFGSGRWPLAPLHFRGC